MTHSEISPTFFIPVGKAMLLGSFGFALNRSLRGDATTLDAFERLAIALIALASFQGLALGLDVISDQLTQSVSQLGNREDLKTLLLDAFKHSVNEPSSAGERTAFNIPAVLEQAWRTGVWGVMTALVEGTFLIVSFVLECAQEVLWKLLLLLFPLAAGVYPVFPRIMLSLAVYAVELSLWNPMLCLVQLVTGAVARQHMHAAGSWGLYIVAVQVIAILLIGLIPSITHQFMGGALSGDFNSQSNVLQMLKRVTLRAAQTIPRGSA